MITMSKSLVARTALGLVALAGIAAAVPASARPFEGYGRVGWGHERVIVEPVYRPVYVGGYAPAPIYYGGYAPAWGYAHGPVVVWHGHEHYRHGRW